MKSTYCVLFSFLMLFSVSCIKHKDDTPANNPDWKLKTVVYSNQFNDGSSYYFKDSTEIIPDLNNNKIVFKSYDVQFNGGVITSRDSSVETFTYDGQNKLVLYENTSNTSQLYASRMEFVRDASGKLVKVLSSYKNGLMAGSEGKISYDKRGDTTFVTFLDSARKYAQNAMGQSFYQTGLVNDKVVYYKEYYWQPGKLDSLEHRYEHDAAGTITKLSARFNSSAPTVYTYEHGSETPKELQKFFSAWAGDLFWFHHTFEPSFNSYFETVKTYTGNVLTSIKQDNNPFVDYTNTFDASGNLNKVSWQTMPGSRPSNYYQYEKYYYRP